MGLGRLDHELAARAEALAGGDEERDAGGVEERKVLTGKDDPEGTRLKELVESEASEPA